MDDVNERVWAMFELGMGLEENPVFQEPPGLLQSGKVDMFGTYIGTDDGYFWQYMEPDDSNAFLCQNSRCY